MSAPHSETFDAICADLKNLSIDEIKNRLQPLTIGMIVSVPIMDVGTSLYRARKVDGNFSKEFGMRYEDLIYPPQDRAKLGRLNRDGESIFYCSVGKEALFYELPELKAGDEVVVTYWKTTEKLISNNVGYTQQVFEKMGAKRIAPTWSAANADGVIEIHAPEIADSVKISTIENDGIRGIFSEYFMRHVDDQNSEEYKLTVAIGELHLGTLNQDQQFAGILYPSVKMWANSDNLALRPWWVDQHLKFQKAVHFQIESRDASSFSVKPIDFASAFDSGGNLAWLGRMPVWTLAPGKFGKVLLAAGSDRHGDYQIDKNGEMCHWEFIDGETGESISPS